MPSVYVTRPQSVVAVHNDRLQVELEGNRLLDLALRRVDTVVCFGRVQVTTHALHSCLEHGIDLAFVTRGGRYKGRLATPLSKNIYLRLAQYDHSRNAQACLELARHVVKAKVTNSRNLLRKFHYNHPSPNLAEVIRKLEKIHILLDRSLEVMRIRGLEGVAAKLYFSLFDLMLRCDLRFDRRSAHPPKDEINSLLSLTYVMVMNEIHSMLEQMGFDPHVGFLHAPGYGKPSLALDILEPFRSALCDQTVLRLCNLRIIEKEDFGPSDEGHGIRLTDAGLRKYLENYEQRMTREFLYPETGRRVSWRDCLRQDVEGIRTALLRGQKFTPFTTRV